MGQISQLEVCQLLSARPQVVYPVGLNGTDEPVTTTLPEQLHSSASIITYEHPYMRIDIPPPPLEELGHPTSLVDKANTIAAAHSPKMPPKPRISIATEVDDLLTQAMTDKPSHVNWNTPPQGRPLQWKQSHSHPTSQRLHPCQSTLLLKQVWRRWRLLLSVSLPTSPPSLLPAACSSASPSVDPTEL